MIRFADYTCTSCGHVESDIGWDNKEEEKKVMCPMCSEPMDKMIGGPILKIKSKTERTYPEKFLNGGDRARFGKE